MSESVSQSVSELGFNVCNNESTGIVSREGGGGGYIEKQCVLSWLSVER